MMPEATIGKLRVWGFLEGASLLVLILVCMPLKYVWGIPEGVAYVGLAHGAFFIFYSIWLLITYLELKWPLKTAISAWVAAFVPGGTFWADKNIFQKYLDT